MIGDQSDSFWRLRAMLPGGWFPATAANADGSPIIATAIEALLWGAASLVAFSYSLLMYVKSQVRVRSAEKGMLDVIAGDFFGNDLPRGVGETDESYRIRIRLALFRRRATRPALISLLTSLTGIPPTVVEPMSPADCGGYGISRFGYGGPGAYGSMLQPYQAFVTVYRPRSIGVANMPGYGMVPAGYGMRGQWVRAADLTPVSDASLYAAVASVAPAGTKIWTRLEYPS